MLIVVRCVQKCVSIPFACIKYHTKKNNVVLLVLLFKSCISFIYAKALFEIYSLVSLPYLVLNKGKT